MARQKGDGRGRLGGRAAGTPNKTTSSLRGMMAEFVTGTVDDAMELWRAIPDPDKKLKLWLDMAGYVLPKPQSIELHTDDKAKTFADELKDIKENGGKM